MTSFFELIQLANTTKSGASATVRKPVDRRNRPELADEVINPAAWTFIFALAACAGLGYAAMFIVVEARALAITREMIGLVAALAFAGAGWAALVMLAYQMPEYRRLRWEYHEAIIDAQEPKDNKRGRWLEDTGQPKTKASSRCTWAPNWKQVLAGHLYDGHSNWKGHDKFVRWMIEDPILVTNYARRFQDGDAQADLRALGWIDDGDNWTERGKAELLDHLWIPPAPA